MDYEHRIPIHLEQEDKFLLFLTARQTLVLGCGFALASAATSDFDFSTIEGFMFGILTFCLVLALSCIVAFVRWQHRDLEQWFLIVVVFLSQPKMYIRGRYYLDDNDETDNVVTRKIEVETW